MMMLRVISAENWGIIKLLFKVSPNIVKKDKEVYNTKRKGAKGRRTYTT